MLLCSRIWLLALTSSATLLGPAWSQGIKEGDDDFGRWQATPSSCLLQSSFANGEKRPPRRCRTVRLDQQLPGLLSLRFSEASPNGRLGSPELTLAGILQPESRAMVCRQGRCQPQWPLALQVIALAERGLSLQPDLSQLPRARLASGDCRLDRQGARCQAQDSEGQSWQLELTW